VSFTSGQYAIGTAGQFANAYRRLRVIWSPNAQPGTGLAFAAGLDGGGGGSILLGSQDRTGGTYAMGQVLGFDGVYSTTAAVHVTMTSELGRYIVDDLWTDGTYIYHARNGRLVGVRIADADVSWTSANPFALNCRPSGAGTLQFGSCTFIDVQLSTTVPASVAVVRADAQLLPGVAVTGALNHWHTGAGLTASTWTDVISSRVLTFTGSPTTATRTVMRKAAGQTCYITDSMGIRMEGGGTGNGPRKDFAQGLLDAGYSTSANGKFSFGTAATKDFDGRNSSLSGQAIGVANGAVASLQSTIAADLPLYTAPDGVVVLMYGANDGYVYCNTPGGNTGAAGAALFFAAYTTLLASIGGHMDTGRPIVVTTPLRIATGSTTAAQRDFYQAVYDGWAAQVATWQATYPGVESADTFDLITRTQADADNFAILPDGTHIANNLQPVVGACQAAAALRALDRAPA
jgi:hypothetical protein